MIPKEDADMLRFLKPGEILITPIFVFHTGNNNEYKRIIS